MKQGFFTFWLTLLVLFNCTSHQAKATISGTITDSQGNPIVHALVIFTSEPDSSTTFMVCTDNNGYYQTSGSPVSTEESVPEYFSLGQNFPNPFNPATTIPFTLDTQGHVTLTIYNIMGQRIRTLIDSYMNSGEHTVVWNACDDQDRKLSAGVYLYHLTSHGGSQVKKMLLLDGGGISGGGIASHSQPPSAKHLAEENHEFYTVTVECFPYSKKSHEHIDLATTSELDFTLQNSGNMVTIPGGTFQMGDEIGDLDDECRPVHAVTLSEFEMSKYEITNEQYCAYLNGALLSAKISVTTVKDTISMVYGSGGPYDGREYIFLGGRHEIRTETRCWIDYSDSIFRVVPGHEDWPVAWVTWYGSKLFAEFYNVALPSEAQWEYACRGGEQYLYGTADGTLDSTKVNYNNYAGEHVTPVGSYPPNPYGLYDMSGNVWEWCTDWYGTYQSDSLVDPTGPEGGSEKVIRGGCWSTVFASHCRSAHRGVAYQSQENALFGFRVVKNFASIVY